MMRSTDCQQKETNNASQLPQRKLHSNYNYAMVSVSTTRFYHEFVAVTAQRSTA
jgi:hypothetical protein